MSAYNHYISIIGAAGGFSYNSGILLLSERKSASFLDSASRDLGQRAGKHFGRLARGRGPGAAVTVRAVLTSRHHAVSLKSVQQL